MIEWPQGSVEFRNLIAKDLKNCYTKRIRLMLPGNKKRPSPTDILNFFASHQPQKEFKLNTC